jgi:glycosyltransferase involved in cell wall biosynthesis
MSDDRVLCILPSLTALGGGIELYLRQFLEALGAARPKARIRAILGREPVLGRPHLISDGLRARLDVRGAPDASRGKRAYHLAVHTLAAARERPTIVVAGHVNYAPLALALARAWRAPYLVLTYGIEAWHVKAPINRYALRVADRLLAISSFTAAELLRSLELPPERVAVIPNTIDLARFQPGAPSPRIVRQLEDMPTPRLLSVCRLDASERYKGIDVVIEALTRRPGIAGSYLVVGDGTDRPRLESLAQRSQTPVRFYGRAPDADLVDLYRAADVFVMPSRNEGFGYVFIEAMACGIPVVAGGCDGSVDALAGGLLGLLVNPLDPDAVADAIAIHTSRCSPPEMRSPERLHAAVATRFGPAVFQSRVGALLDSLVSREVAVG